ncbi:hypothetical protein GH714_036625 [Hevea brasiliensis]|uniref:Carbohydrate kinase PfkB domain-containing protein n=1 Tax=Hevea brasiliensis TaxID=3981 RepID=A0A6A6LQX0_HEVBR|nr:hypothetical protein GH714_036625 [Hevea brasiliensis]
MHQLTISLHSPSTHSLILPISIPNRPHSNFASSGIQLSLPNYYSTSLASQNGLIHDWKLRSLGLKNIDVATLGNLCVDIVLNVLKLPPRSLEARKAYLEQLSASPPDKQYWEAGGNCNVAVAAARLGLSCATIGHVGNEIYGNFLLDVLRDERISVVGISEDIDVTDSTSYETLLCWVLVDPLQRHGFCSRADFSNEPAFSWLSKLSAEAESLTGIGDPLLAGQELLRSGIRTKWVIVKMGYRGSILVTMSSISCAPAFKVDVIDTVGCGDSFVAAIAYGFIHNMPLVNTLTIANAVGAATAMGCGAGRNVATLEKVIELVRASNLNEDDEFWNELVNNLDAQEVTFLSKMVINGSNGRLNRVALQKVVSELLPKLKSAQVEGKVPF